MKQTLLVKLAPTPEQHMALLRTLETFNSACDWIAAMAFREQCANKVELQKLVYYEVRQQFGLSAQMTIRTISKVCEAYKRDKAVQPQFRPHGAMVYDERICSFPAIDRVSLLSLEGRLVIPVRFGAYQAARLERKRRQCDLLYRRHSNTFFLAVTVDAPEHEPDVPAGTLGVDLGIVNLALDSDGEIFSGAQVERVRQRHLVLRAALQKKGTKSAKRHLKKLSGKERRFHQDTNHCISKQLVAKAKHSQRGLALEDLRHIRTQSGAEQRFKKSQRARHAGWSFFQLRACISYKAALAGVCLHLVNPQNTSCTCSQCGHCAKENRKSQAEFVCVVCGYAAPADFNAAVNVAKAPVKVPIVSVSRSSGG